MLSLRLSLLIAAVAVVVSLACLVGFAQDAKAGATIDLIWNCTNVGGHLGGCGSGTINILDSNAASETVTLDIFLLADESMAFASISLQFDADGVNELNALSVFNWGGFKIQAGASFGPLGALFVVDESGNGGPTGLISSFSAAITNPTVPAPAGTYHIGSAVFHLTANTATDGIDITSLIDPTGIDFISNGSGLNIKSSTLFGTATVNHIPEPGTASLLGLGLVGLVLAARRRSSAG